VKEIHTQTGVEAVDVVVGDSTDATDDSSARPRTLKPAAFIDRVD